LDPFHGAFGGLIAAVEPRIAGFFSGGGHGGGNIEGKLRGDSRDGHGCGRTKEAVGA